MMDYYVPGVTYIAIAIAFACAFLILLCTVPLYVLQGLAYLRFARKTRTPNGWMGFVPVANTYLLGRISDAGFPARRSGKRLLTCEILVLALLPVFYGAFFPCMLLFEQDSFSGGVIALGAVALLAYIGILVAAVFATVFTVQAFCRIAKNFGGASYAGWTAGLIISLFCSPVAYCVLLMILSGKTPAYTENDMPLEG